jgi:hypothetical protein
MMRWCLGPCRRLLSVVAFRRGSVCGRCRDVQAHARARGQEAFARHLALPLERRGGRRRWIKGRAA